MKLKKFPTGEIYLEIDANSSLNEVDSKFKNYNHLVILKGELENSKLKLFAQEFKNIEELSFCNWIQTDYSFLYELKDLKRLILRFFKTFPAVLDFEQLPQLESLGFNYIKKQLKNLCSQTSLQKLSVSDYTEKDMNALSCLTSIKEFTTIGGKMKSLDGIQHLTNLEKLEISAHRSLTDISQIVALKNLTYLEINTCWKMADFSPIGKLKNLKQLEIIDCKNLGSIKFVKDMPNLKSLNTSGTTIINDYDTTPAEHVPVFWGSQYNKYNKQYPEKEIRDIKLEDL